MTIAAESQFKQLQISSKKRLMNSINWPALSVWVFIAQLGEHCSANSEAMGSIPIEAQKPFFGEEGKGGGGWGLIRNCLNCGSTSMVTHSFRVPS